jgi:ketosteroid isomerase-like protein
MSTDSACNMPQREYAQHVFSLLANGLRGDRSDMQGFADEFTEDAQLWLPPTPNTQSPYRGRAAIRALLVDFVLPLYRDGLALTLYGMLSAPGRVLFQFEDQGTLQDGRSYTNSPCIALGLNGTQITSFHEYWGGPSFFSPCFDATATRQDIDQNANKIAKEAFSDLQQGLAGDSPALDRFLAQLADDVRLWFPPTPNTQSPYVGRSAASKLFRELLVPMYPQGLHVTRFHTLAAGTRTAFELQSYGRRADGSEYINSPCLCLDVRSGLIRRLWEHWGGPGYFDPAKVR